MNYYQVLGVSIAATQEEIEAAYKAIVKRVHPDKSPERGDDAFKIIEEAYAVLRDLEGRREHDRLLRESLQPALVHVSPPEPRVDFERALVTLEHRKLTVSFPPLSDAEPGALLAKAHSLLSVYSRAHGADEVSASVSSRGVALTIEDFRFEEESEKLDDPSLQALDRIVGRLSHEKRAREDDVRRARAARSAWLADAPLRAVRGFFSAQRVALLILPTLVFALFVVYYALDRGDLSSGLVFGFLASLFTAVAVRYFHYGVAFALAGVVLAGARYVLYLPALSAGPQETLCSSCSSPWNLDRILESGEGFSLAGSGAELTVLACPSPLCPASAARTSQEHEETSAPEAANFTRALFGQSLAKLESASLEGLGSLAHAAAHESGIGSSDSTPSASRAPEIRCTCGERYPLSAIETEPTLFLAQKGDIVSCPRCAFGDGEHGRVTAQVFLDLLRGRVSFPLSNPEQLATLARWKDELRALTTAHSEKLREVRSALQMERDVPSSDLHLVGYYEARWDPNFYRRAVSEIERSALPYVPPAVEPIPQGLWRPFTKFPAARQLASELGRSDASFARGFIYAEELCNSLENRVHDSAFLQPVTALPERYFDDLEIKAAARNATAEDLIEIFRHSLDYRRDLEALRTALQRTELAKRPLVEALELRVQAVHQAIEKKNADPRSLLERVGTFEEAKEILANALMRWVTDIRTTTPYEIYCEDMEKWAVGTIHEADRLESQELLAGLLRKRGVPEPVVLWAEVALLSRQGAALPSASGSNPFDFLDPKPDRNSQTPLPHEQEWLAQKLALLEKETSRLKNTALREKAERIAQGANALRSEIVRLWNAETGSARPLSPQHTPKNQARDLFPTLTRYIFALERAYGDVALAFASPDLSARGRRGGSRYKGPTDQLENVRQRLIFLETLSSRHDLSQEFAAAKKILRDAELLYVDAVYEEIRAQDAKSPSDRTKNIAAQCIAKIGELEAFLPTIMEKRNAIPISRDANSRGANPRGTNPRGSSQRGRGR